MSSMPSKRNEPRSMNKPTRARLLVILALLPLLAVWCILVILAGENILKVSLRVALALLLVGLIRLLLRARRRTPIGDEG